MRAGWGHNQQEEPRKSLFKFLAEIHSRNRPTWTWCWLSHVCSLTFWRTKQFMILYHRQITVIVGILNCWASMIEPYCTVSWSFARHGGIRHFIHRDEKTNGHHSGYGSMLLVLANQKDAIQSEHGHLLSVFPSVTQRLPPMIIWCSRMTRQYLLYLREEDRNWNLANCLLPSPKWERRKAEHHGRIHHRPIDFFFRHLSCCTFFVLYPSIHRVCCWDTTTQDICIQK